MFKCFGSARKRRIRFFFCFVLSKNKAENSVQPKQNEEKKKKHRHKNGHFFIPTWWRTNFSRLSFLRSDQTRQRNINYSLLSFVSWWTHAHRRHLLSSRQHIHQHSLIKIWLQYLCKEIAEKFYMQITHYIEAQICNFYEHHSILSSETLDQGGLVNVDALISILMQPAPFLILL